MRKLTKTAKFFCSKDSLITKDILQHNNNQYELINMGDYFTNEYFEKKGNLLVTNNEIMKESKFSNIITGVGPSYVRINDTVFSESVMITPNAVFIWNISRFDQLTPKNFEILKYMRPKPEYLLIGNDEYKLNEQCMNYLQDLFPELKIDVLDNFTAVSTFNSCMTDNVRTIAFVTLNQLQMTISTQEFLSLTDFPKIHPTIPLIILLAMFCLFIMTILYSHHKEYHTLSETSSQYNSQDESGLSGNDLI